MASMSLTAFAATILLLYLSTFILCAIIRIATGISIQRIGYFSLRRVAYAPKDGLHLAVRGIRVSFHRPSFTQPTYISLRLKELTITVDPNAVVARAEARKAAQQQDGVGDTTPSGNGSGIATPVTEALETSGASTPAADGPAPRKTTWKKLTSVKEVIKRIHKQIRWLTLVDVVATDTTLRVVDAGDFQIGTFTLVVDTRRKTIEQGRLFRHKKEASGDQQPAEWTLNARNLLLAVKGCEQVEILDNLLINIHGLLHKGVDGLRDVSIAIKAGKLHAPYDDLVILSRAVKDMQRRSRADFLPRAEDAELSFAEIVQELDSPGSREEAIVRTVADYKEFVRSLLGGIQEIQLGISFFRASRTVQQPTKFQRQLYLNVVTHEVGVDLHRMDPSLPAHRMYFQRDDIAHQALLAAISLSVSLADTKDEHQKILYIPMATATIRTTLPSKTVTYSANHDANERNTNVLFANLVVTSPAVDLEPRQFSDIMSVLRSRKVHSRNRHNNHLLISHLLPKASIKLSVHEPVLRFVLPLAEGDDRKDYNMLVSSISSLALDIESSHSAEVGGQYSLASVYRVSSHQLYYQTAESAKHRLLSTETMEVKVHLNATNEVCVLGSGTLNTFSLHLASGEVIQGVHQVVERFHHRAQSAKFASPRDVQQGSLLRRLPPWLVQFQFETSGFSLEIAGVHESVGLTTRGIVLQLQGCKLNYQSQRPEPLQRFARRRTPSHSALSDDPSFRFSTGSPSRKSYERPADGRRLTLHGRSLEGFVIESADYMEPESFLSIPRFEIALTTSSDLQGPIFHVNAVIHEILLKHSLYRYYAVGIAACALRNAFATAPTTPRKHSRGFGSTLMVNGEPIFSTPVSSLSKPELLTVDIKTHLIQVKSSMPHDPPMLLQLYGLVAGRHRWSAPFMRCQLARLHAEAPKIKGSWARIVSINSIRLGLRESHQKQAQTLSVAKFIDITTDFIRLAVPHHMVMYRIFDNFVNTAKAIQQLNHRFKTQTDEYILKKGPEGPKKVPRISLRTKALLFELEDDPFEWKLGSIYRLGLLEQRQRLAREESHMMKIKKLDECCRRKASSQYRSQEGKPQSKNVRLSGVSQNNRDTADPARPRSGPRSGRNPRTVRYNAESVKDFSESRGVGVSRERAWTRLQELNARSWKTRVRNSIRAQNLAIKGIRSLFAGVDEPPDGVESEENILPVPNRPGLLAVLITDVHLTLDKPSFPLEEYPKYLHEIGKGMPLDTKYALLIPMSLRLNMGEARAHLRDYPLDFIHIPSLRPDQPQDLPSWSLSSDFVIAEEYRDAESSRHVIVDIVPPSTSADGTTHPGFSIDVRRTVSPVKMYSNPTIEINSSLPTCISWGMSYQPVIQDMMKIIENFTKPEVDPSERVGFWDKIRLSFHSRLKFLWKGDGDVHLRLKGIES
jgi:hypothetical protein